MPEEKRQPNPLDDDHPIERCWLIFTAEVADKSRKISADSACSAVKNG
jgi:hypothetical protein